MYVQRGGCDGQQPQPQPSAGETIHVEDLAGVWSSNISAIRVYGSTGAYAPAQSSAGTTTYTIPADAGSRWRSAGS